jgi:hypothetical protein
MKSYHRTSVNEFLGDLVVYRNLVPVDPRLPPLGDVRDRVGLPQGLIPRKSDSSYARVIVELLRAARVLEQPGKSIERLVYLGDTRLNDGTAFANICDAGEWPGLAFIASEDELPAHVEVIERAGGSLYLANRWAALFDFDGFCRQRGFALDERTAVIVDLDKTALGARGRNDHVIDRARVEAVRRTVGDLLGDNFDSRDFQMIYERLNQTEFHPFTADNQDYLAYICLILGGGLYQPDSLVDDVRAGRMKSFEQFISEVDGRVEELPADLRVIHDKIYHLVKRGDPTPFKEFRYNEFQTTIGRMGRLSDDALVEDLLREEIVITQEVREMALRWRSQGALLLGLSDKPDEASIPSDAQAAQGYRAIHQTETHAVGG